MAIHLLTEDQQDRLHLHRVRVARIMIEEHEIELESINRRIKLWEDFRRGHGKHDPEVDGTIQELAVAALAAAEMIRYCTEVSESANLDDMESIMVAHVAQRIVEN